MIKFSVTTFWFLRNIKHHNHATFMNQKVVTENFIIELTGDKYFRNQVDLIDCLIFRKKNVICLNSIHLENRNQVVSVGNVYFFELTFTSKLIYLNELFCSIAVCRNNKALRMLHDFPKIIIDNLWP